MCRDVVLVLLLVEAAAVIDAADALAAGDDDDEDAAVDLVHDEPARGCETSLVAVPAADVCRCHWMILCVVVVVARPTPTPPLMGLVRNP